MVLLRIIKASEEIYVSLRKGVLTLVTRVMPIPSRTKSGRFAISRRFLA
jgi:hypothetical protein